MTSAAKGVYPPSWWATSVPFTQTVAAWCTAPKCRTTRCPAQSAGTVNVRRYQAVWSQCSAMPEASVSQAKGTVMARS